MFKRLIDILLSSVGVVLFLPIGIVLSIILVIESGFPVFFIQERIGKDHSLFNLIKFRSMKTDSKGLQITAEGDSRITKVGAVIRKYKLDEFPQLINVLKGEMSLVGPRPEVARYISLYNEKQKEVLSLRPGITGLDSLAYSNESELMAGQDDPEAFYIKEIMPKKLALSLEYKKSQNLKVDFGILVKTFSKIWT